MERHTKESAIMALADYRAKLEDCRKRAESSEAREAKLREALDRMYMTVVRGHSPADVQQQCKRILDNAAPASVKEE